MYFATSFMASFNKFYKKPHILHIILSMQVEMRPVITPTCMNRIQTHAWRNPFPFLQCWLAIFRACKDTPQIPPNIALRGKGRTHIKLRSKRSFSVSLWSLAIFPPATVVVRMATALLNVSAGITSWASPRCSDSKSNSNKYDYSRELSERLYAHLISKSRIANAKWSQDVRNLRNRITKDNCLTDCTVFQIIHL